MFQYLITVNPLGLLYGSAGPFLSPENLVGRSGAKFPPEAATLSGLYFRDLEESRRGEFRDLVLAGPFWAEAWAEADEPKRFYVPIPRSKIIGKEAVDEWRLGTGGWERSTRDLTPDFHWQSIHEWNKPADVLRSNQGAVAEAPWKFIPMLHPRLKADERTVVEGDLFLENAVQMKEGYCLVYLATHPLPEGWYRFGGENHIAEVGCQPLGRQLLKLLRQPVGRSFALITPGVWGSNRFSYRHPQHPDFPEVQHLLTEKPVPYRYHLGKKLSRGRYAVPAGSVYVLDRPIEKPWFDWAEEWFPKEGRCLRSWGCGLALPLEIPGLSSIEGVA
ncbi:type III-B CRISPR module-associated Cmr3 family protein [Anthocerotibacter panamensis]|uniref:type III-B CRISPR module-associated Cmr3 family protein n=1 Tax=Anthocerotibacter panamensis TaxID=2857077 RepID=UPI001C403A74|nr:type III-B CRISPR module-associated Cmr3 family protein [Anthocerotibacter panamensis]